MKNLIKFVAIIPMMAFDPGVESAEIPAEPVVFEESQSLDDQTPPDFSDLEATLKPKEEKPKEEEANTETPGDQPTEEETPSVEAEKPSEPATEDQPSETAKPEDEEDEDLKAIQPTRHAPPAVKNGIKTLKGLVKETRSKLKSIEEENIQLKTQLESAPKIDPEEQKRIEEAKTFYRLHNLEKDPEFVQKFDAPIKNETENLITFLKGMNLPEETANAIRERGVAGMGEEWFYTKIIDKLRGFNRTKVESAVSKIMGLQFERKTAVESAASDLEAFNRSREEAQQKHWQTWSQEAMDEGAKIAKEMGSWAQEMTLPANATPEQKAEVEQHNAKFKEHLGVVQEAIAGINTGNPRAITRAAMAIAHARHLTNEIASQKAEAERYKAEAESLRAQLGKIKSAGKVSDVEAPPPKKMPDGPQVGMTAEEAINQFFPR